jgi:hypothetical protein
MLHDAFKKLDSADTSSILDIVNPKLAPLKFNPAITTILAIEPLFYPGYRFLDIADFSVMPTLHAYVLYKPGADNSIVILDWTNAPLYKLNAEAPIALSEENITEYIKFFFTYVRGKQGRIVIAENIDDIPWREDPPPQARKALGKMLIPLEIKENFPDKYKLSSTIIFKDSLFKADIEVSSNGQISLNNEQLLVEDMPVLDDTFGL